MNFHGCGFFILVLLFSVVSSSVVSRNKFTEGLLKVIDKWRTGDVRSLPFALPTLPLKLPPMKLNIDGYTFEVSELKIKGLENMVVKKLTASESALKMSLDVNIPVAAVHADRYHLQGSFWVNDAGRLSAHANNLKITANIQFGSEGANTVIKHLNFDYSVGRIQVDLSGSWGIVNNIVNNKVSEMIRGKNGDLMHGLRNMVTETVNTYLRGHTPAEFIKIISSF